MAKNTIYQGIVVHPYIKRKNKMVLLVDNATDDSADVLMCLLDMAENMCLCSEEEFNRWLPAFKKVYSTIGDVNKEIEFIKQQRKVRV